VKNPFRGIEAALFDLDGTLIETHIDFPSMKREMISLAGRFGIAIDGLAAFDILTVVETAREHLEGQKRYGEAKQLRMEAFQRLEEIEIEQCGAPRLIPGAAEVLHSLRDSDVKIGIVTRNCRTVSKQLLDFGRLYCDALVTRDDVPRTKPDPRHPQRALELLGIENLESEAATFSPTPNTQRTTTCIMVGDHWIDVQAGKAAGMRTVGVLRNRAGDFFSEVAPDLIVGEIRGLLPLLSEAFEGRMLTEHEYEHDERVNIVS
jgi:phosphoglycolate phosphatase